MNDLVVPQIPLERQAKEGYWLLVVWFNLGRGYSIPQLRQNILTIMEHADGSEHVALLGNEIDEDDKGNEKAELAKHLEPGTHKIAWDTHEPQMLSPGFKVARSRQTMTMDSGLKIGAPAGTGPRRYVSEAVSGIGGLMVGTLTDHPHRNLDNKAVQAARHRGRVVFRRRVRSVFDSKAGTGAHLDLRATGVLPGTIDGHDPLWARFRVTPGKGVPYIWASDKNAGSYPLVTKREKTAIHRGLDFIRYANH